MNIQRFVSTITAFILIAIFMFANDIPATASAGTIRDEGISSEVVLVHE